MIIPTLTKKALRIGAVAAKWIFAYPWVLTTIGAICLVFAGVVTNVTAAPFFAEACKPDQYCLKGLRLLLTTTWEGSLTISGLILSGLGSLASFEDRNTIDELRNELSLSEQARDDMAIALESVAQDNELKSIDSFRVISLLLREISSRLSLSLNERISVYRLDGEKFFILGRYSENVENDVVGRSYYEKSGVLLKAWTDGWHVCKINANPKDRRGFENTAKSTVRSTAFHVMQYNHSQ